MSTEERLAEWLTQIELRAQARAAPVRRGARHDPHAVAPDAWRCESHWQCADQLDIWQCIDQAELDQRATHDDTGDAA